MPETTLKLVDWLVMGSYFVLLLIIALYYRHFAGRSMEDYFLSGRRNSGWANGVSYAAAMMNADVAPAYSGVAVATGVFVCWFYISRFALALFIGGVLFAVFWRRLKLFTTPEFYELRFGGTASSVIRTWVALRCGLIAMVAWTGTGLLAIHKIAEPVLGFDKTTSIALVVPVVLAYVVLAGLSGVVATAAVQSLIMLVGSAMLCGIVLHAMGGPAGLAAQLAAVPDPHVLRSLPPADHWFFPAGAAIAWIVATSVGYGGDTAPLGGATEGQMVLSSRNSREASKMYIVATVTLFVLLLLVTLPSLAAIVEWPSLRQEGTDREQAYGLLMSKYLPPGMLGLLFVTMLAAVMSTIGSNLIFGAQVLVSDVYRRYLRREAGDRHYLWVGRGVSMLILALAILVAYRVELIFDVAVFMVAASAAELPANWAQWWWWRFNRWGRIAASFGAIVISALIWFLPFSRAWPWWEKTFSGVLANTALWIVVTLLTSPDRPEILRRFYDRARPLGAWGPLREAARDGSRTTNSLWLILGGLGLALLGAGSVALGISALSIAYVARYGAAAAQGLIAVAGGAAFLALYGRYLRRLDRWTGEPAEPQPVVAREPSVPSAAPADGQPAPTSVIVALATAAYGLIMALIGLLAGGGERAYNLIAGLAFLLSATLVWWLGRAPREATESPAAAGPADQPQCDDTLAGAGRETQGVVDVRR